MLDTRLPPHPLHLHVCTDKPWTVHASACPMAINVSLMISTQSHVYLAPPDDFPRSFSIYVFPYVYGLETRYNRTESTPSPVVVHSAGVAVKH